MYFKYYFNRFSLDGIRYLVGAKLGVDAFTRQQFCHCTSDHIMERENVMEKQGPLILK